MSARLAQANIVVAATLAASAAHAACTVQAGRFSPWENDTVTWTASVTGNGACRVYVTSGARMVFKGLSLASRPSHGSVAMSGAAGVYQAKPGFTGSDSFSLRACGSLDGRSGCSTINVALTVQ